MRAKRFTRISKRLKMRRMNKMARNELLQVLLEKLEAKYGDLDDRCGCNVHTDRGYEWLSVADIVDVIMEVDEEYED
jgi:hypothetical protein